MVLGAVLAVFGGLIASFIQHFFIQRRIRSNVRFLICQLLHDCDDTAQGIAEGFARSGLLLIERLNEANGLMVLYDRNREWVLLQSGVKHSRDVWRWFAEPTRQ